MHFLKFCSAMVFGVALAACGGGGGNPGSASGVGTPPTPVVSAADFDLAADKTVLLSTANETAAITITAVDANRNVLPGVAVAVTVDSGGIFTPVGTSVTSATGVFSGNVSVGADKTSRTLKVTAVVGTITKTISIAVTGSAIIKSDYIFDLDKTIISNSGSDQAILTVTALDEARNVVAGVPVTVSIDSGGVFTRTGLAITDAAGKFTGSIRIGSDKSDRTINATVNIGGLVKVASVLVSGSVITVTAIPSTPKPGEQVKLNLFVGDKSGTAIPNTTLSLSGTAGVTGSVITDSSGAATKTIVAPTTAGSYTILVAGSGVKTSVALLVIDPSASSVPPAVGFVSAPTLSAVPSLIPANIAGSNLNKSKLTAKFLTPENKGIENMRVRFVIFGPGLGSGESISTLTGTVYSDASGTATSDYISGTRTSPTNGVVVRACYSPTDFIPADSCLNFKEVNLTVAGTPLSVSISSDNKIAKGLGDIAYVKQYLIQVNDAAGVAVKDAVVSASVDITHYGKGRSWNPTKFVLPTLDLKNPGNNVSTVGRDGNGVPYTLSFGQTADTFVPIVVSIPADPSATPPILASQSSIPVFCANEDSNRNGFLDSLPKNEDKNQNGILEPRKADIIVSYVNGTKTNENGQMLVQATWGQSVGGWLYFTLRATVGVDGSEGDASQAFMTTVAEADVQNGSFLTPPYGSGSCSQKN